MKMFLIILILFSWSNLALSKSLKLGGSDTGGGSGYYRNGELLLKDFANCKLPEVVKQKNHFNIESISKSVSSLDSAQLAEFLAQNIQVQDSLVADLLLTAASRANFYLVDANLENNNNANKRLAVFKRPLGITIDKNLFNQLNSIHQIGLIFHETLRMVSIGFEIQLSENEIEEITCKAFSQSLSLENTSSIRKFLNDLAIR